MASHYKLGLPLMRLAPARQSAFAALLAIDRGAWSAEALAAKSVHLDPRDAALASDIVFGTLRRQGQIDAIIDAYSNRPAARLDPAIRIAIRIALYQIRFLDRIPPHAAVNDSVELARRAGKSSAASLVNAILRRSLREPINVPDTAATPVWLLDRWTRQFGAGPALAIAGASLLPPDRYIRVPAGSDPPIGAEPTDVPGCFELPIGDPAPYRFQDIGSQAIVPLLNIQPGDSFLDLCASPGNKTAQSLEMRPGLAIASDLHLSRARTLLALGIPVVVLDATRPLPFSARFDRILVDAPCSGTGTLSRNPEIKWRITPADLVDLQRRQIAILRNALQSLAPGGRLVYSTCSLEREENEDVVAASGAEVLQTIQRLPGRDPGDGFFAALLKS